jgi:inorganic pyrophosphatase|mmetsp:Transcript_19686/g.26628  ORF Transcript_19686/g.26628 Transcript_19686/m.26628 type:complete len:398 (-) Transcript_19686:1201-2394(-)
MQQSIIVMCAIVSIVFGLYNVCRVIAVKVHSYGPGDIELQQDGTTSPQAIEHQMMEIARLIQDGASTFLKEEYFYTVIFILVFAVIIFFTAEQEPMVPYTTVPFLLGAFTSIISGYIGMQIAVRANVRTAKEARHSLDRGFNVAFRGGLVLGFTLVGLALLVLILLIIAYRQVFAAEMLLDRDEATLKMFEAIAGYGLGGSTVALFGRVGGGIYTKAADVGADLVGKVVEDLDEDSIMNPGVIADNVGDNVGDIAGMGSDLFGSFAEATCACLVISATSKELVATDAFYYPLMISAGGIVVGVFTAFLATNVMGVHEVEKIERTLKVQIGVSTIAMTPVLYILSMWCLPAEFKFLNVAEGGHVTNFKAFICTALGLWSGLIIGVLTEYFTSTNYAPV